jgi:hypothetical protein
MTHERDFDRLARAWLELGPNEAPDRVVAAVLQASKSTPQVRRSLRWPDWRSPAMNRLPLVATVVAVLVVVIGGGMFLTRSSGPMIGGPSASPAGGTVPATSTYPTPGATGSSASTLVPPELQYIWVGPRRTVAGLPATERYRFSLTHSAFAFPDDSLTVLALKSTPSVPGPGQLRLVTTITSDGCQAQDEGTYHWALSAGGVRLTLSLLADACATRANALVGEWTRVACKDASDGCYGNLEAGAFSSQYVDPKVNAGGAWHPRYGALTYTVPAGWANSSDWPTNFSLTPSTDYALWPASGSPAEYHSIEVQTQPAALVQDASCTMKGDPTVQRTVDGLIGWIASRPSLKVTPSMPIAIGGMTGRYVDVTLASSWTATCPDSNGAPVATFLMRSSGATDDWAWGIGRSEQQRLILLDVGGGNVVLIGIDSSHADRYAELIAQAMPIVQSFVFR